MNETRQLVPVERNGQRVITTELLARVYETDANNIKNNFNNHRGNFKEGIHYFLLRGRDLRDFKREVHSIDLVAPNVNRLYLWTERGANRHCKILDTPKAWEQFDNLEETYFLAKGRPAALPGGSGAGRTESQLSAEAKRAAAMVLNAKNRTAERLQRLWDRANVSPEYQALALGALFAEDGVDLPRMALRRGGSTYDRSAIARRLGVFSRASGGRAPHAQAIGAILAQLDIGPEEREPVPYSRNGHSGIDEQYAESVVEKVRGWLEDRDWPAAISGGGRSFGVTYRRGPGEPGEGDR